MIFKVIIAILVGLMFVFLIVAAVSGSVVSILLSDYCVGGVDNLTRLAITTMINDTCTQEAFIYYLFCYWGNATQCDTLDPFSDNLENHILILTQLVQLYPNNTLVPTWSSYARVLRDVSFRVNDLSSCSSTQQLYLQVTSLFCGSSTPAIIMFGLIIELMVGIEFIFLLVVIRFNPEASGKIQDDVDIEMEKRERRKKGLRPNTKDMKKDAPVRAPTSCGIHCITGFFSLFGAWAITILVFMIIMSTGSNPVLVSRTLQNFTYGP